MSVGSGAVAVPIVIDWAWASPVVAGRLLAAGDEAFYIDLFTDPSVMAQIAPPLSRAQATEQCARCCRHNANPVMRARYWYLSRSDSAAPVGLLSLIRDLPHPASAELGLMLLPQWHGRGIGLQALREVVNAVIADRWSLGIDTLIGRHAVNNPSAGRLVEALGFTPDVRDDAVVWRWQRGAIAASHEDRRAPRCDAVNREW